MTYKPKYSISEVYDTEHKNDKNTNEIHLGCYAKLSKINDSLIQIWVRLFYKIKKPFKFYLKSKYFKNKGIVNEFLSKFGPHKKNIILLDGTNTQLEHLRKFLLLDIHLDTWPYSGTTISSESLYLGIPVVTLCPDNAEHVSRVTGSILMSLRSSSDLEIMISKTPEEYIEKVLNLIENLPSREQIHNSFMSSPITDYKGFMEEYEKILSLEQPE